MTRPDASPTQRLLRALFSILITAALFASTLFGGLDNATAHDSDGLIPGDHGEASDDGFWNVVEGFATKTGYRLVFIWDADEPIAGVVNWGFDPDDLDQVARPVADAVDSAGIAIFDVPRSSVVPGKPVYFQVLDELSGEASPVQSFSMGNAWRSDASDGIYEINLLFQLDSQSLPPEIPADVALLDIAKGADIMAERIWDATDGYVRFGKVVVTDTVLNYPANQPFGPGLCAASQNAAGANVQHTLTDVLVQTTIPFDSHTWGGGTPVIDDECTGFYVGRIGQLVVPWEDDLHFGSVSAHEFGHYAFGLDDLYPEVSTADCWVGTTGVPDNSAGRFDITIMHNRFGWSGGRWQGSELDRGATTPCQYGDGRPSWPILAARYPEIPALGRLGNGLPDHSDSTYNQARDNPDGGTLSVFILDHEPLASGIDLFIAPPEEPVGNPEIRIDSPVEGANVSDGPLDVSGIVDRLGEGNAPPTASLAADVTSGEAPLDVLFTLGATDPDGTIDSWSLDPGDGSTPYGGPGAPPATQAHTYATTGTHAAELEVTDDEGATASASVSIHVGGMPQPDGAITGDVFAYNEGGIGLSNVGAIVTGTVTEDDTPKYVAGETITMASRSTVSGDPAFPIDAATPVDFFIYDEEEELVAGPLTTAGSVETLGSGFAYSTGPFTIPTDWGGIYFLLPVAHLGSVDIVILDNTHGVKPIQVVGSSSLLGDPNDDAGHSIGDPNDDATSPFTEIHWVDVSLTPNTLDLVIQLKAVQPPVGDSPFAYAVAVNGLELESFVLGAGEGLWDNTNGQAAGGSTVWDTSTNQVFISVDRGYLAGLGLDCPCAGHVETRYGEGLVGGLILDDRAPDNGEVALQGSLGGVGAGGLSIQFGAADDPEATDPQDTDLAWMDIRKIWIHDETPTTFEVTMQMEDLSLQPPSVDVGAAKASTTYTLEFCLDNNVNAGPGGPLFCYRMSAVNGLPAPTFSGGIIQQDGSGSCGLTGLVDSGAFDLEANTVTWRLTRAGFDVTQNGPDVQACLATPPTRGGNGIVDGTTLSLLEGSTGNSAGAVLIATFGTLGDTTDPSVARPYVFGAALDVDAGGPYFGAIGTPISIEATATGGTPPYQCLWSGGGSFADAGACATTVTFSSGGTFTLDVTATDASGDSASDTAAVTVTAGERVDVFLDDEASARASVNVSTSAADPTANWSVSVDLSGLGGSHKIKAKWFDADGSLLATDSVNVNVTAVNQPPVANAGADQTVDEGDPVTLSGSAVDPDGDPVTYEWSQIGGPAVTLSGADTQNATFTAPQVNEPTVLTFRLTAEDGNGGEGTDDVQVAVLDTNQAPTLLAGPVVEEGTDVILSASASDPEGEPLTYEWSQISGPAVTLSGANTSTVAFTAPQVNEPTVLVLRIVVDDGNGGVSSDDVQVTVKDKKDLKGKGDVVVDEQLDN